MSDRKVRPKTKVPASLRAFFLPEPPWWFRDLFVGLLLAGGVALVTIWVQNDIEERQAQAAKVLADSIALQGERADNRLYVYTMSSNRRANAAFDEMDLTGQDLTGVQLPGADFRVANLTKVRFSDADLRGVDFWNAQWDNVAFLSSDLRGSQIGALGLHYVDDDVPIATVRGSDFSYAKLVGLYLNDIGGATFAHAQFGAVNLSRASVDDVRAGIEQGAFDGLCYDDQTVWPDGLAVDEIPPSADFDSCTTGWTEYFYQFRPISVCGELDETTRGDEAEATVAAARPLIQVCPGG